MTLRDEVNLSCGRATIERAGEAETHMADAYNAARSFDYCFGGHVGRVGEAMVVGLMDLVISRLSFGEVNGVLSGVAEVSPGLHRRTSWLTTYSILTLAANPVALARTTYS